MEFMKYSVIITKNYVGEFKIEIPKNKWIDECIALRSKTHSFKSDDKNTNKLKGNFESFSRIFDFEENKKCLDAEEYQRECNNYVLKSK